MRGRRCPRGADQPVGLLKHVVIFGLLPGEEAERHEGRAKHQSHQHDPAVGAFVGGVE